MNFIKTKWRYILVAFVALIIGASTGASQDDLDQAVKEKKQMASKYKAAVKDLEKQTKENKELQAKVDEAAPFFALSKTEQENEVKEAEAKKEKLKAEEAKRKAEAKAKKEAEMRAAAAKAKAERAAKLAARTKTLSAGKYKVGRDVEPGLYDTTAVSGQGNFVVSNDYDLKVNEMFGVGDPSLYNNKFNNLELEDGDEIEINSGLQVKFTPKD